MLAVSVAVVVSSYGAAEELKVAFAQELDVSWEQTGVDLGMWAGCGYDFAFRSSIRGSRRNCLV